MRLNGQGDRSHIQRAVPCGLYAADLREMRQLPCGGKPADRAQMAADAICAATEHHIVVFGRTEEDLADGKRRSTDLTDAVRPRQLLRRQGIFKEKQLQRLKLLGQSDCISGIQTLMNVGYQPEAGAEVRAQICQQRFDFPRVTPGVVDGAFRLEAEIAVLPRAVVGSIGDPYAPAALRHRSLCLGKDLLGG